MTTSGHDEPVIVDPTTQAAVPEDTPSRFSSVTPATRRFIVSFAFFLVLYGAFGLAKPIFLSVDSFWTLSQQGSLLLLVALGATFVVMMGMIDLSIGSLVTLAAMTMAVTEHRLGAWAVLVAIVVTTGVGALNGTIVTVLRIPSFLVTLGTLTIIQGVALYIGSTYVQFQNDFVDSISIRRLFGHVPIITVWAALLTLVLSLVARYTVFGRGVYAIGGGEKVSQIVGLPIKRYKVAAFALSGLTCGVAGVVLAGQIQAGTPTIGASFLLSAVAAVAVGGTALTGGVGGPWGTALGAAIITVLAGGLVVVGASQQLQYIIQGAVVIVAVYFTMDRDRDLIIK